MSAVEAPSLVLASASRSRRNMLEKAGISCGLQAANLDEGAVKTRLSQAGASPDIISETLAMEKARHVAKAHPGKIILGADQLLVCDDKIFDKPATLQEAETHLHFFRGKEHFLYTSYALVQEGETLIRYTERPRMVMRNFSEVFLTEYLEKSGSKILSSVGCYLLEDLGSQLFEKIDGDYYTILGLPLLHVMTSLRDLGVLRA